GCSCGFLGSFAVLQRRGLIGDALAHATLPGLCLGFLAGGGTVGGWALAGAAATAVLASWCLHVLMDRIRMDTGSALAAVLTVFFGGGVALLSLVNRLPMAGQAGLEQMLFGQAAALVQGQVILLTAVGAAASAVGLLLLRPFAAASFDPQFSRAAGVPVKALGLAFSTLMVASIVVGLQAVGVVLVSAMLVAPCAAARLWTRKLPGVLMLATGIGGLAGVSGAMVGAGLGDVPTGPVIVLILFAVVAASLAARRLKSVRARAAG
ncbi:MAG: metal ABC transporter permease, partial [Fimbriimonadaceae bacterium]|nr:metal ABC transporter permease [Fimbriimonadaceae bacterium]